MKAILKEKNDIRTENNTLCWFACSVALQF